MQRRTDSQGRPIAALRGERQHRLGGGCGENAESSGRRCRRWGRLPARWTLLAGALGWQLVERRAELPEPAVQIAQPPSLPAAPSSRGGGPSRWLTKGTANGEGGTGAPLPASGLKYSRGRPFALTDKRNSQWERWSRSPPSLYGGWVPQQRPVGGGRGGSAGAVRARQSGGSEAGGAPVGSGGSPAPSTRQVRRSRAQALGVGR